MQANNPNTPTIVLYKSGDQITRVLANQVVRVIILDADGADLEEEASRVIEVADQSMVVTDLLVSGVLGANPQGEQAVDPNFVQSIVDVVAKLPEGGLVNFNKPGQFAESFPVVHSVHVKHWGCYDLEDTVMTHQIDLDDQRVSNGQVYLTVGALEGDLDEMISVVAEVSTNPLTGLEHLPSLNVSFDSDATAFKLLKLNDRLLLQCEEGVTLKPLSQSTVGFPDGMKCLDDFYVIE